MTSCSVNEKWKILFFVLVFSLLNQWIRWLPVYLSSVSIEECQDICDGVSFTPLCQYCISDDTECSACHGCRSTYDSSFYNLLDGVCMSTTQYGVITGMGFALTFSAFGLFAGFFVDMCADWGSTVLGLSALLYGFLTLLSSYSINFMDVLILRAFLGALQAFGAPASVYLITNSFTEPTSRLTGNTAYTIGLYLGAGCSSLSTLMSADWGWRLTSKLIGYIIILIAIAFEVVVDIPIRLRSLKPEDKEESITGNSSKAGSREEEPLLPGEADNGKLKGHHGARESEDYATFATCTFADSRPQNGLDAELVKGESAIDSSPLATRGSSDSTAVKAQFDEQLKSKERASSVSSDIGYTTLHDISPDRTQGGSTRRGSHIISPKELPSYVDVSDTDSSVSDMSMTYAPEAKAEKNHNLGLFFSSVWNLCFQGSVDGAIPLLLFGSSLRFTAGILVFVFVPVLTARKFPMADKIFSMYNAIVVLSCGSFSSFMGGKLGELALRSYGVAGLARLICFSCLLSIGPFIYAFQVEDFWWSMLSLSIGYLVGEAWMGAAMAMLQVLSPRRAQGLAMSLFLFLNWIFSALGTDFVAWLDPGTVALTDVLIACVAVPLGMSCVVFFLLDRLISNAATNWTMHVVESKPSSRAAVRGDKAFPRKQQQDTEAFLPG